jgi:hypothetical protein
MRTRETRKRGQRRLSEQLGYRERCRRERTSIVTGRGADGHFWRFLDGPSQCVNFQASVWGSPEACGFTINLDVSSPALFEGLIGRSFPKVPAAALYN